jgi:hypothetical protein
VLLGRIHADLGETQEALEMLDHVIAAPATLRQWLAAALVHADIAQQADGEDAYHALQDALENMPQGCAFAFAFFCPL